MSKTYQRKPRMAWLVAPTTLRASRRFVPQVVPPPLRPAWRVAIKGAIVLVACTFLWRGSGTIATALVDRNWDDMQALIDSERAKIRAASDREQDEALRKAYGSNGFPGDEQLCELLYHRDVAACDSEMLKRLADEEARRRDPYVAAPIEPLR